MLHIKKKVKVKKKKRQPKMGTYTPKSAAVPFKTQNGSKFENGRVYTPKSARQILDYSYGQKIKGN